MAALLYKDFLIIGTGQFDKDRGRVGAGCRYKRAVRHCMRVTGALRFLNTLLPLIDVSVRQRKSRGN
jgi:hypothetical protein